MGLFDRLRRSSSPAQASPSAAAAAPVRSAASPRPTAPQPRASVFHKVGPQAWWVPPGQPSAVAGWTIPNGMIYVGERLASANGRVEPALIDPTLRIERSRPDWDGRGLEYWPSYSTIPPASRSAYMAWLADGRRHPQVPIGYVFLFFYGLERRVLVEMQEDQTVSEELPAIRAEVRRLLSIYGNNSSFRAYATRFLDVIGLAIAAKSDPDLGAPSELARERWPVPMALRLSLGVFATDRTPVPAGWARAWAWYLPSLYPRTAQTRCPEEFNQLFAIRYTQRFRDGLVIRPGKSRIRVEYRSASAGIGPASLQLDLPDVLEQAAPTRRLADLVESVTDELDAYSRWLGRNPDGRSSLAAAALLPADLVDDRTGQVGTLHTWCEARLASRSQAVIEAADLIALWPTALPEKMAKAEAVSLAQLLGRLGFGVEPDVRLGGPALSTGPAILFRTAPGAPHSAGPSYVAATTLLHLAVAVSAADGTVSGREQDHLVAHVEAALHLTAGERARLHAHLLWLSATGAKLTGLKRRLETLSGSQRESIGEFLITVAAADGIIAPEEVTTLTKIYRLLGLAPDLIYARLHQSIASAEAGTSRHQPPAVDPVVVRPAGSTSAGYALPPTPPAITQAGTAFVAQSTKPRVQATSRSVSLDEEVIAAKLAETAAVSELLARIFIDEEPATPVSDQSASGLDAAKSESDADEVLVPGLDAAHTHLLHALALQPTWTCAGYEELAERHGVMPAGALDVLNEVAIDITGEPVVEGDDDIAINQYALQELLS